MESKPIKAGKGFCRYTTSVESFMALQPFVVFGLSILSTENTQEPGDATIGFITLPKLYIKSSATTLLPMPFEKAGEL
jgi:hypothetical protein